MTAQTARPPGSARRPLDTGGADESDQLDEARFEAIYREYQPTLVRFAARRNADDPEAAADHALFEYYRAWHRLERRDDDSLRSYLLKATASQVVGQHRHRTRSLAADELTDDRDAGPPTPAFDDDVVDAELLQQLIAELSPAQRDTILQRFYLDLTAEEAGRLQGRQANAVHQLQHRAVANLRKALLAGLAVVLIVLAVWLARGATPAQPLDTDPADIPSTSTSDGLRAPDRDVTAEAPGTVTDDAATGLPTPGTTGPSSAPSTAADRPPVGERPVQAPETSEPTSAGTPTSAATPDPQVTSSSAPASTTTTGSAATTGQAPSTSTTAVAATQGLNRCVAFAVGSNRIVVTLFDPAGDVDRAESYVAPSTIRFVDSGENTVLEIRTDGGGVDGDTSGSAGWLEFGGGVRTARDYADASPPTEWGVLLDNSVPDDWVAVHYTDALGRRAVAPTCNVA